MKTFLSLIAILASLSAAQAQSFVANLNGAQDGGGARQGTGHVDLTLSGNNLTLSGSYSGISANATAGHIHGPAAPGTSTGVIYDLVGPGILTINSTSGTYGGPALVLADKAGYTLAQQLTDLNGGLWYLNIHDATFPGGEIRGQILPVPEPSAIALIGLGLGTLCYVMCRRTA
ncbi:MAG TPA: CHRD domain-containing protein [Candidatus Saccharimonadales bacterium]|nr:CHRD domain-containing protein [Candidatus Saccharimonadales bacterium]